MKARKKSGKFTQYSYTEEKRRLGSGTVKLWGSWNRLL